jgi:DNA-binding FrmR family transcriptional regulator
MKDDTRQQAARRLKSLAGHLQGVLKMVDEDRYCIEVIKQIDAVEEALHQVKRLLLAGHLDSCVTTALRGTDKGDRERVLRELLEVYDTERRVRSSGTARTARSPTRARPAGR